MAEVRIAGKTDPYQVVLIGDPASGLPSASQPVSFPTATPVDRSGTITAGGTAQVLAKKIVKRKST